MGKILEREWGISCWVKFGEKRLAKFIEGVEGRFVGKTEKSHGKGAKRKAKAL